MLVTFSNKWSPRNKFTVHPDELATTGRRRPPAAHASRTSVDIDPEELEGYRTYKKDLGVILTVLERHPDALNAVRKALSDIYENRDPNSPPPRPPRL